MHKTNKPKSFVLVGVIIAMTVIILTTIWKPKRKHNTDLIDSFDIPVYQENSSPIQDPPIFSVEQEETEIEEEVRGEIIKQDVSDDIHELIIEVVERCWVRVVADGDRVFEETMQPGDTKTWIGQNEIIIKLGNAGGVLLTYNNEYLGPPGEPGHVIELSYPPQD